MNDDIKLKIEESIKKGLVSSRILLDRLRVIEESSRKSGAYQDPSYFPFYYHLGKFVNPKNIANIGFRLALHTCCFLKSCRSVAQINAFERRQNEFYSPKLALANIKDIDKKIKVNFHYGKIIDFVYMKNKVDMVLFNEQINQDKMQESFELMWELLNFDGLYVVDYIDSNENVKNAFESFCNIINRNPIYIKTRYGIGIIQK